MKIICLQILTQIGYKAINRQNALAVLWVDRKKLNIRLRLLK
jgi:hypothetical protein